jgi:hypothetical protein
MWEEGTLIWSNSQKEEERRKKRKKEECGAGKKFPRGFDA